MLIQKEYPCHPGNYQGKRVRPVEYLVIHYVGALGDARQNAWYYHSTPGIGASAHYFVGHAEDGADVWASVAEDCVASHCGRTDGKYRHPACRNANSIGIEMCCHRGADGTWYFDAETVERTVVLARDIMARYGIGMDRVVRHYDVTGKVCPAPYVLNARAWEAFKARLEECEMTKQEIEALVAEAVKKAVAEYEDAVAEANNRPVSPWAAAQWEKAKAAGVFDGSRPGAALRREEAAAVLDRLGMLGRNI